MSLFKSIFAVAVVAPVSMCNPDGGSDPVEPDECDGITTPSNGSALRSELVGRLHTNANAFLWELGDFDFEFETFNTYDGRYAWMTGNICRPDGSECTVLTGADFADTLFGDEITSSEFEAFVDLDNPDSDTFEIGQTYGGANLAADFGLPEVMFTDACN